MTVLAVLLVATAVLLLGGRLYSRFLARHLGEDPSRVTPAVAKNDGADYVPTPTPVVFAHHFASIAGAGPIIGPVVAVIYGWAPALLWVLGGSVLIGAVHDYLATYMSTREGGVSIATIARRLLGQDVFIALTILLVVMLALVCAAFLNLSAAALTSKLPFDRLDLAVDQTTFRVEPAPETSVNEPVGAVIELRGRQVTVRVAEVDGKRLALYDERVEGKETTVSKAEIIESKMVDGREVIVRKRSLQVVIGGIASTSVLCITAVAPLIGWLYIKRKVSVWICSGLAVLICGISIAAGVGFPVALDPTHWRLLLAAYVLVAAGVPVWIFLQSRDFINVHILYVGLAVLVATLAVAGLRGAESPDAIQAFNVAQGAEVVGMDSLPRTELLQAPPGTEFPREYVWPGLFILIACGAVSGFHSLCAGGTTCKQITSEKAARQIGYYGMLLEAFLAVCVLGALMIGIGKTNYLRDVYAMKILDGRAVAMPGLGGNPVLGFAMAVGNSVYRAFGIRVAVGALAGMILLEGFLVTTLDTAVRLTRYLIEEIWRALLGRYDVFAEPVAAGETTEWGKGQQTPIGADGIPAALDADDQAPAPARPVPTRGLGRSVLKALRLYWVNSGLAVALMLAFALTGAQGAIWKIFATSNQLLAAMVLSLGALWLLRQRRKVWFIFLPAVAMLVTTATSLVLMLLRFLRTPRENLSLLIADIVILAITAYLLVRGAREAAKFFRSARAGAESA